MGDKHGCSPVRKSGVHRHTQFIVITHRRGTMEAADVLYGVTMQEDGVSKILRLDLDNVSADLIT